MENKRTPVDFTEDQRDRIQAAMEKTGIKTLAGFVRMAAMEKVQQIEAGK